MGCDIHSFAEVRKDGKWIRVEEPVFDGLGDKKTSEPFGWRSYSTFGFLADVRNYIATAYQLANRGDCLMIASI